MVCNISTISFIQSLNRQCASIDVTNVLTNLIIESTSDHAVLTDQYVVLHASLVSAMYKVVGIEFGTNTLL